MYLILLNESNSRLRLDKAYKFCSYYHSGRITRHAMTCFRRMNPASLRKPGTAVVMAFSRTRKLVGVLACENFGEDFSFIVVHPRWRGKRVGTALLKKALDHLGHFYARIACDNTASLALAFSCGMVAYDVFIGRNGKPTLKLVFKKRILKHTFPLA